MVGLDFSEHQLAIASSRQGSSGRICHKNIKWVLKKWRKHEICVRTWFTGEHTKIHWNYESWSLCVHSIKSSESRFSWQTDMCGSFFYIMNAMLLFMFTLIRYRALSHLGSYLPLSKLSMCDFVVQAFALCLYFYIFTRLYFFFSRK